MTMSQKSTMDRPKYKRVTGSAGEDATLTVAPDPSSYVVLEAITWSYDDTPGAGLGRLTVTEETSGDVLFDHAIIGGGIGEVAFPSGLSATQDEDSPTLDKDLVILLEDGGGTITGEIGAYYR